jgi:hypothetical protein
LPAAAAPGAGVTRWATTVFDGRTHVIVFTSPDAMRAAGAPLGSVRSITAADLVATWPDGSWWLAVNPGLPIGARLPPDAVARLPVPPPAPRVTVAVMPPAPRAPIHDQGSRPAAPAAAVPDAAPGLPGPAGPEPEPTAPGEAELAVAIAGRDPDGFTAALLRAELHLPVDPDGSPSRDLTDPEFPWWRLPDANGQPAVAVFTSEARLRYVLGDHDHVVLNAYRLASVWPDPQWAVAVNPGTSLAASLPGGALRDLGSWLQGLSTAILDGAEAERRRLMSEHLNSATHEAFEAPAGAGPARWAQMLIPHAYVSAYLEQGYNRAAGLVHPWFGHGGDSPARLYRRLGVLGPGSPFLDTDRVVCVLRWRPEEPDTVPTEPRMGTVVVPDGAEIHAIYADRPEVLVARYDATAERWEHP